MKLINVSISVSVSRHSAISSVLPIFNSHHILSESFDKFLSYQLTSIQKSQQGKRDDNECEGQAGTKTLDEYNMKYRLHNSIHWT